MTFLGVGQVTSCETGAVVGHSVHEVDAGGNVTATIMWTNGVPQ